MTWMVRLARTATRCLPALVALGLSCYAASAATLVKIKNSGHSDLRIAFDGGQAMTIAPGASAQATLNPGDHSADCHFDGTYVGCNLAARFTLGDPKELELNLRPTLTLQHAVQLTQSGMMSAETSRDVAWATNTLEVQGGGLDCADYRTGKLAGVSRQVRSRAAVGKLSVATRTFCGDPKTVVAAAMDGAQLYFDPRFLIFRDARGRQILVIQ